MFVSLAKNDVRIVNAEIVENVPLDVFNEIIARAEPAYSRFCVQALKAETGMEESTIKINGGGVGRYNGGDDSSNGSGGGSGGSCAVVAGSMMMREKRVVDDAFALVESVSEFISTEVIAKLPRSPVF